jgi:hypothetical protein
VVAQVVRVAEVVDPTERIADITDDPTDNRSPWQLFVRGSRVPEPVVGGEGFAC